jgi:cysteine desulfurase
MDPRVIEQVDFTMRNIIGNPSSADHTYGEDAKRVIQVAASHVADLVGCRPDEVVFTSGSTESVNLGIFGTLSSQNAQNKKLKIARARVEHKAVLEVCRRLAMEAGIEVVELHVDHKGRLDLSEIDQVCRDGASMICVMAANNEVGNIYPAKEIALIASKYKVPFFCDAAQAAGKTELRFDEWGIALMAISGHKMYGPKGVGALVVRKGHFLRPLFHGGGQQGGIRPGTMNVHGIAGFGEACRLRKIEMTADEHAIRNKRDRLEAELVKRIPNLIVNGDPMSRLAGNLHISIPDVPNDVIISRTRDKIAISTGSACTSGVDTPSHVLAAMGLRNEVVGGAIRIGIGKFNTDADIDVAIEVVTDAVVSARQLL